MRADAVVGSVGVDIHLHNGNTLYNDFPKIEQMLVDLGVRHTRDGLIDTTWTPYYQRHNELGKVGIGSIYITNPKAGPDLLRSWPSRVSVGFEGYEAPNEYDHSKDPNWAQTLQSYMQQLYQAVKSDPFLSKYPVIGPSLIRPGDYPAIAGMSEFYDIVNLHNYFGGRNPGTRGWGNNGYGSILFNINLAQGGSNKVVYTTETGYLNNPDINQSVPELVAGKYMPRVILEQLMHGVSRTYIYELLDEGQGPNNTYGLARIDGTPKPAYVGLRNLLTMLKDPGPVKPVADLDFSLSSPAKSLHHLLLEKADGTYYLVFWLEDQNYDVNKKVETPSQPQQVTFSSARPIASAEVSAFSPDGTVQTSAAKPGRTISLTATDCLTVLKLK